MKSLCASYFKSLLILIFSVSCFSSSVAQENWNTVYMKKSANVMNDITFADSLNGYIVGQNGLMLKTTDGGNSWDSISSNTNQTLYSIVFANKNTGYACGHNGTIIKTIDGGKTWELQKTLTTDYFKIIKVISADTAYAFGHNGRMLKTTDGGKNWVNIKRIVHNDIEAVHFYNSKTFIIASSDWNDSSVIYKTKDAGLSWNIINHSKSYIFEFCSVDTMRAYAIQYYDNILKTTDGCKTWQEIYGIKNGMYKTKLSSIQFINKDTGYVTTDNSFLKTTDGGTTWNILMLDELGSKYFVDKFYITPLRKGFILAKINKNNVVLKSTANIY
jgi:photosystem II stability/assembly factor-like uncharacterized protein